VLHDPDWGYPLAEVFLQHFPEQVPLLLPQFQKVGRVQLKGAAPVQLLDLGDLWAAVGVVASQQGKENDSDRKDIAAPGLDGASLVQLRGDVTNRASGTKVLFILVVKLDC
jgi:hypothetical protein